MPNWVKNNVSVTGDKVAVNLFADRHFKNGEEGDSGKQFNFETIVPMPEAVFRGPIGAEEQKKYGDLNWYDWSIQNWGTKWNAHDTAIDGITEFSDSTAEFRFTFYTAWSCPEQIYSEIAKIYPNLEFDVEFADEDIGSNCGSLIISDGGLSIDYNNDQEFAKDVWGYDDYEEEV